MAGISAAQALANASITDFVIIEYQDRIGGRVHAVDFGKKADQSPYKVELGANWVHGTEGIAINPIWTLAQKYDLKHGIQNFSNILNYNETGLIDITYLYEEFEEAAEQAAINAGALLEGNHPDQTARANLALAGWRPDVDDAAAGLVEWFGWDFNDGVAPEVDSATFGFTAENLTYGLFGDSEALIVDSRGYSAIISGEASTFLQENDPRLLLNTIVTNISHSEDRVTVYSDDGSCISAAYAITTFSLGVLQHDSLHFAPALPEWKETAIQSFGMATYTKIFLQFNTTWWPSDVEFFGYASPTTRGYYPMFQSLDVPGFLEDSHMMFMTVTEHQAYRAERQTDEETKAEIMEVLREMFPAIEVPDPVDFMYPRWTLEPWARGSYSYWPPTVGLQMHQNLRANVGRLFFAGEHISGQFYGYLHGSYFSGREMGERVAGLLGGKCRGSAGEPDAEACGELVRYEVLSGVTPKDEYDTENGWPVTSVAIEVMEGGDALGNPLVA